MSAVSRQGRTQRVADAVAAAWLHELGAAAAPVAIAISRG